MILFTCTGTGGGLASETVSVGGGVMSAGDGVVIIAGDGIALVDGGGGAMIAGDGIALVDGGGGAMIAGDGIVLVDSGGGAMIAGGGEGRFPLFGDGSAVALSVSRSEMSPKRSSR